MTETYDDIINLPHHVSVTRPHMTAIGRAAQFSPFAALTGYDAAIKEIARLTNERVELDEYIKDALSDRLKIIADRIKEHPEIAIAYFQPDTKKNGGTYVTTVSTVKKIDENERVVVMTDGILIPIDEIISIPVIAFVVIIYNSPFSIFFPPLEDGDTIMSVTRDYEADFDRTVTALANEHGGCDAGEVVYVDYEGLAVTPSNYYDVMAVYMVRYGVGDTATVMNDTTKSRLKVVFDDMCFYQTSTETRTDMVENEDGTATVTTITILNVNVSLKSYRDMIREYEFSADEVEMLEDLMNPEYLAMIGYTGGTGGGSSGGGNAVSELSASEIADIVSGISDQKERQTVSFALSKVGYPYSQAYRDSGNYYDCSSLAYYSWKSAGVDISFGGATTAAAETQGLQEAGKAVAYDEIQPGDLIFYSYCNNGRYKNISHVAIYAGNGKVVEAINESMGVVYRDVSNIGSIVMVGRP